tara:strand:- start:1942 stop:2871 length:930 start_codon:yes stop_codon:yes gene_type:complete
MFSQTCCSGGVPLSNNLGLPNEGKGVLIMGLNYDYNNLNTLNAGTEKLEDNSRQRITNSILLNVGYAFTDRFSVETLFTWVNQTRTINQFGNENFTETSGTGDAVLLIKYSIPDLLGKRTILNIGVGTKVPFGKSDILSDQGIQLTADLQPGSGAWDGIGWLSASKQLNFRPSATVSTTATYRFTGVNSSYLNNAATYEFGNEIQTNLGYSDQFFILNTLFNPGLVFKYRRAFEDKIDDIGIPNTGGEWFFIRPELGVQLSPKMNIISRVELPIYSNVVGTQLTPTVRFTIGIIVKFKTKQTNILNITP